MRKRKSLSVKPKDRVRFSVSRGISSQFENAVDFDKNVIYGVSAISLGEARGHGVEIDEKTVEQVVEFGNRHKHGLKSRFGHPTMSGSAMGTELGRMKNFYKDTENNDAVARADLHLSDSSFKTPNGNLGDYTLSLANEDPDQFGCSIVVDLERKYRLDEDGARQTDKDGNELLPLARVRELYAVDVVDEPATGDGMFSSLFDRTNVKWSAEMTAFLDKFLQEPQAVDNMLAFLQRYRENDLYKDSREIQEKLTKAEEIIKQFKSKEEKNNSIKEEDMKKKKLFDADGNEVSTTAVTTTVTIDPDETPDDLGSGDTSVDSQNVRNETLDILNAASTMGITNEFAQDLIKEGLSYGEAMKRMVTEKDKQMKAVPQGTNDHLTVNKDGSDKQREILTKAILVRETFDSTDTKTQDEVRKSGFGNVSLQKLAAHCLANAGVHNAHMLDGNALFQKVALEGAAGQGTGDFVNVLSNVLNKFALKGWTQAEVTYRNWAGQGSLRDFKQADLLRVTDISDINEIKEGEAPKLGQFTDMKENARLRTYGLKNVLTRQAMVNDDMSFLTSIPEKQMNSLARHINYLVYSLLLSGTEGVGPDMVEDSKALFHADHNNLASAGAPSDTTLKTAFTAMAKQVALSPDGGRSREIPLNIKPKFILSGATDSFLIWDIFNFQSVNLSTDFKEGTIANNYFRGGNPGVLTSITEPVVETLAAGHTGVNPWYLLADPNAVDTLSVYTLNGNSSPYTISGPNAIGEARGLIWVIEYDVGVAVGDWRGMYRNPQT